jgi:hypothetical protein
LRVTNQPFPEAVLPPPDEQPGGNPGKIHGVPPEAARALLTSAFLSEALDLIIDPATRDTVDAHVSALMA